MNLAFLDRFSKKDQYQISWRSVQWEPSGSIWMDGRTDRQTDKQTHMAKLMVSFRNSANEPNNIKWAGKTIW